MTRVQLTQLTMGIFGMLSQTTLKHNWSQALFWETVQSYLRYPGTHFRRIQLMSVLEQKQKAVDMISRRRRCLICKIIKPFSNQHRFNIYLAKEGNISLLKPITKCKKRVPSVKTCRVNRVWITKCQHQMNIFWSTKVYNIY